MRSSATAFLKAANARDKQRAAFDKQEALAKILCEIAPFLNRTKSSIMKTKADIQQAGVSDTKALLNLVGMLEDVHFVSYSGEQNDIRHVLLDLQDTSLWKHFCQLVTESPTRQATLLVSLKGGVALVMTNKAIVPYPGCFFHKVVSGNEALNDIYMFRLDQMEKFLRPEQVHTN